jgi:hypothetical protein
MSISVLDHKLLEAGQSGDDISHRTWEICPETMTRQLTIINSDHRAQKPAVIVLKVLKINFVRQFV